MTARKRLDEMTKFMKIAEGAWDLPRTKEDFDKLADILRSKEPNVKIYDMLYNVLGDDDLFDRLDKLDLHDYDASETIIQWMKDQRRDPHSNFPNIWKTYQLFQHPDSPMNEEELEERVEYDGVTYGGVKYPYNRVPIEYYRQFKAEYPGARVRFRGPRRGSAAHTRMEDATHFYIVSTKNIDSMSADDFGPAAQGKSDIVKKYGAEQSKEVTDLSLSELDEDPEEFKNTIVNPQWKERRAAEIQKRKDWLRRTYQAGDPIPDDLYMARVKTPKGTGTVYSINNYEPSETHDYPAVSVRLDNDPGGFGGGKLQYIFKLSDVEILPDELDEVGDVKFDDYGAVDEDHDPEGMGRYEVVVRSSEGEDYVTGDSIPYDKAEILAKETVDSIVNNIPGDSIVTKEYRGDSVWFKIIEPAYEMTSYVVIEPDEMYESISLDHIVENLLKEYPGQSKDDYDPYDEADQREMADDMNNDYEKDEIDPKIEDDELGYRFD